jgi:hypothetical protein
MQSQKIVWPGQAWSFRGTCAPVRNNSVADSIIAFFLSLNGQQGTFLMGDRTRRVSRGSATGAWTVGAGAAMLGTTLPTVGAGELVVGDWLQIGGNLYRVVQYNDSDSYEVWPRLRSAYVAGTAIVYNTPLGLFQLADNECGRWSINMIKHHSFEVRAIEAV